MRVFHVGAKKWASATDVVRYSTNVIDGLLKNGVDILVRSARNEKTLEDLVSFSRRLEKAALKSLEEQRSKCKYCDEPLGDASSRRICDFDDGLGGRGCGAAVCKNCWVTTECGREVGGA